MADDAGSGSGRRKGLHGGDEPYQELVAYTWTETAFHMLERGELHGEAISRDGIVRSRVWGPCPRCGHNVDDQQTHTAMISIMGVETRGWPGLRYSGDALGTVLEVDVSCGCADPHAGAPEGLTGCGVSFRVALPLQAVGKDTAT